MNRSTSLSRTAQTSLTELQAHEREAQRLRAECATDPVTRVVLAVDLQTRRAAHLASVFLHSLGRTSPSTWR